MSYFKNTNNLLSAYNTELVLSSVGANKDSYSIASSYKHNIETDEITHNHTVVKNWVYNELGKDKIPVEGKKYREELFTGTIKECYEYIDNIANNQNT